MDKEDMGTLGKAPLAMTSALGEILSILPLEQLPLKLDYCFFCSAEFTVAHNNMFFIVSFSLLWPPDSSPSNILPSRSREKGSNITAGTEENIYCDYLGTREK